MQYLLKLILYIIYKHPFASENYVLLYSRHDIICGSVFINKWSAVELVKDNFKLYVDS